MSYFSFNLIKIKPALAILFIVGLAATSCSQSCKKKYKDKLEEGAKLLDCGGNYTVEKRKDKRCVVKRYYPENKVITYRTTYKSKKRKVRQGPYLHRWDDGTLVSLPLNSL